MAHTNTQDFDLDSSLNQDVTVGGEELDKFEQIVANKVPSVRTVLVVMSSHGMVVDRASLEQKIRV